MNDGDKPTSADALTLLQAAAGTIGLRDECDAGGALAPLGFFYSRAYVVLVSLACILS